MVPSYIFHDKQKTTTTKTTSLYREIVLDKIKNPEKYVLKIGFISSNIVDKTRARHENICLKGYI